MSQMLQPLLGEQSEEGEGRFITQTRGLGQRHLRKVAKNAMMPRENIWALARPFGMTNKSSQQWWHPLQWHELPLPEQTTLAGA